MSRLNGDRSRHNRVRKSRMHQRERIRAIQKELTTKEPAATKSEPAKA
jgi:hypothetical protein